MVRTLLIVPRMYSKKEFIETISYFPDDYEAKSEEFWSYVTDKLGVFRGRVRKVFVESLSKASIDALKGALGDDPRGYALISLLLQGGAELKASEDAILVAESESWLKMIRSLSSDTLQEFYEKSLAERNRYIESRIRESLSEGEVGLLVIDSRRNIKLPDDIQLIRVRPFDPADYLNVEIVKKGLKSKEPSSVNQTQKSSNR